MSTLKISVRVWFLEWGDKGDLIGAVQSADKMLRDIQRGSIKNI